LKSKVEEKSFPTYLYSSIANICYQSTGMVQVQSKLLPITTTCIEYVHPWTHSCWNGTAGLLVCSAQDSFRIYSAVYLISLALRSAGSGRLPKKKELAKTIRGILQSTAFLTTNAFCYPLFLCLLRSTMGTFNFLTISYVPSFLASWCAIMVERPSRRGLLTLYVANVATETLWQMLEARQIVRSIKYGQTVIFALSSAILMYFYRSGHHLTHKDQIFSVIDFAVGKREASCGAAIEDVEPSTSSGVRNQRRPEASNLPLIMQALKMYQLLVDRVKAQARHVSCPHRHSCVHYSIEAFTKLFGLGVGIQVTLRTVLQLRKIIKDPKVLKKVLFSRDTVRLGLFFGGFAGLFRASSCALRHIFGRDSPSFAIPAALIAGTAHAANPDVTIALYIMWKALQLTYNMGVERKQLPTVPGFGILFYCACTALLFHVATLEPTNLRSSYWKFLHGLSGGRVAGMGRECMDVWGLETSKQLRDKLALTNTSLKVEFTF
jgi:putative component of membrane protein insertase Oxa1/YidC/SpoIIIJ protein YidD